MTERFCLRCDWTGEEAGPECPRCGAPLYRSAKTGPTMPGNVAEPAITRSPPAVRGSRSGAVPSVPNDDVLPPIAPTASGRWPVIVLALILATAGFGYALVRGSPPDPADALAPENVGPEAATRSAAFPSLLPDPSPPAPPRPCGEGPATQRIAPPTELVPAPAADYRFQGTFGSVVGNAPDLVEVGRSAAAFVFDASVDRTVLKFSGRGGLALTPATGIVYRDVYTIELLFRFDRVDGFRKLVDFNDGSDDDGVYVQDGCLTFFPRNTRASRGIQRHSYVQVVLTRDSSERVVGYVDAVRQFAFRDAAGLAEIASKTLRFFADDSPTRIEYSNGAVTQIRLYDRALTAGEVAVLACSVQRVPLATDGCPA